MKVGKMCWLGLAALLLGGFAGTAWAQKKLVVYSANDSTLNDLVFAAFAKETGIQVEPVAAGSGVLVRRLQAEKQRRWATSSGASAVRCCTPTRACSRPTPPRTAMRRRPISATRTICGSATTSICW